MDGRNPEMFEPPKKKIACLRHADADGMGAALAVWKRFKDEAELLFIPVQYGQEPPLEELRAFAAETIYIVDFSYDHINLGFLAMHAEVIVIDHHKTAKDQLKEWGGEYVFNLSKSGAALTWEHLHDSPVPPILQYVQDRDLWKFELPNSKAVNAYIACMPETFEEWDNFLVSEAIFAGQAILAFQKQQIERRLKDVRMVYLPYQTEEGTLGYNVPFVNASENISELGEAMCLAYPEAPFSVSYCDRTDGKRSYSLRSRFGFDVSEVAKAFGGGGHPASSGYTLDAPDII